VVEMVRAETAGIPELLNVKQVAAILGVKHKRVYELPVPQTRLSERRIRFHPADVQAFIDAHRERYAG
jgi:predicted DNA-binding transcriptional regulator AlpA